MKHALCLATCKRILSLISCIIPKTDWVMNVIVGTGNTSGKMSFK